MMGRIIMFVVVFLLAAHCTFGQATPVERYRIANNITAMGVNMPAGTQVYDITFQKLYIALRSVPSTITIKTGLADSNPYFKEFASPIEFPRASDGTIVVELTSPSGRTWMDRNLGASQAATSETDYLAYGSLFQWCRAADGHERITWTNSTTGTPVNSAINSVSNSTNPGHSKFIISATLPPDWLSTPQTDGNLWWNGSFSGDNNPCPTGYHVPSEKEWNDEGITNKSTAYSKLKLSLPGYREPYVGSLCNTSGFGYYWSSTTSGNYAKALFIASSNAYTYDGTRASGFCVRCIKNQ